MLGTVFVDPYARDKEQFPATCVIMRGKSVTWLWSRGQHSGLCDRDVILDPRHCNTMLLLWRKAE